MKILGLLKRVLDIMVGGEAVGVLGLTTRGGTTCVGLKVGAIVGSRVPPPRFMGESFEIGSFGEVIPCLSRSEGDCRTDGAIFIRLLSTWDVSLLLVVGRYQGFLSLLRLGI